MKFSDFDLLPQSVIALERQNIHTPTPIQEQAIPLLLGENDLIGQAQTGSGKTLAFSLPMLEFIEPDNRWVQALVVTPTRELANQITDVITELGRADGIKVLSVYGGRGINPQITALRRGAHVLVATPGRLIDLMQRKAVKLDRVSYAVIDEADEMLDHGFARDVEKILKSLTGEHITALFSATMPEWVHQASKKYLRDPKTVKITPAVETEPNIEHVALTFESSRRMEVLEDLLGKTDGGSSIVFGRTKHGVRKLAKKLDGLGYSTVALQGNMSQNARDRAMRQFRDQEVSVLVATNVAARGLDVDHVELVVNFELPENSELLTHRIGRTGRMGREGQAFTLVADTEEKKWRQLKRGLKDSIPSKPWNPNGNSSGGTSPSASRGRRVAKVDGAPSGGARRRRPRRPM